MKNFLVLIAMVCSMNMFSAENKVNDDLNPLIIYTTCGTSYEIDDAGMSWDDIFDLNELYEYIDCEDPWSLPMYG